MISAKEKAIVHAYPNLIGLSTLERRQHMVKTVGCYSSLELDQARFEHLMASLEELLWTRVEAGTVPDPRACRKCGSALRPEQNGFGVCPRGCERRKVFAWGRTYWRDRLPDRRRANSRQRYMIRNLWGLLQDYLPAEEQTDAYLGGIWRHAAGLAPSVPWNVETLSSAHASALIDALKDRLTHAVPKVPQALRACGSNTKEQP